MVRRSVALFVALAVVGHDQVGLALPQLENRLLIRCPQDPALNQLAEDFDVCSRITNHVACITQTDLSECSNNAGGQRQPGTFCCDPVGMKLRELAPAIIIDPDETNCATRECVCQKRDGRRVLEQLKRSRSGSGIKYAPFHDYVTKHFRLPPEQRQGRKLPPELANACFVSFGRR